MWNLKVIVFVVVLSCGHSEFLWNGGPNCRTAFGLLGHLHVITKERMDMLVTNNVRVQCCHRDKNGMDVCFNYRLLTEEEEERLKSTPKPDTLPIPIACLAVVIVIVFGICFVYLLVKHWRSGGKINNVVV